MELRRPESARRQTKEVRSRLFVRHLDARPFHCTPHVVRLKPVAFGNPPQRPPIIDVRLERGRLELFHGVS